MKPHYYECHVTISPVEGDAFEAYLALCTLGGFRVAKLLMRTGEPSRKDAFCTGRDDDFESMKNRMIGLVKALKHFGFTVTRYKIEAVLLDSKAGD